MYIHPSNKQIYQVYNQNNRSNAFVDKSQNLFHGSPSQYNDFHNEIDVH